MYICDWSSDVWSSALGHQYRFVPRDGPIMTHAEDGKRGLYTRPMNVVVLPTYNERENLRHALGRIREVADGNGLQLHTLIVDDNSPDGTGQLADELAHE